MATINLSDYSISELKGLQFDIEKEIKDRQQQEVQKARDQILSIAQNVGISVEDLLGNGKAKSKAGSGKKVPPMYHNPSNQSQTWSGRGRKPLWFSEALSNGKTLDELKI